jgi:hypothetical protein
MFNLHKQTIEIDKDALLKKLKENLIIYQAEYKEAVEDYNKLVIQFSNDLALSIVNKAPFSPYLKTKEPADYTVKYEEAIDMLEYSVNQTITLDSVSFRAYIKNEWDWTNSFRTYASSLKG